MAGMVPCPLGDRCNTKKKMHRPGTATYREHLRISRINGTHGYLDAFEAPTIQQVSEAFEVEGRTAEQLAAKFAAETTMTRLAYELKNHGNYMTPEEYKKACDEIYAAKNAGDNAYMELIDSSFERMSDKYEELSGGNRRYSSIKPDVNWKDNLGFTGNSAIELVCKATEAGKGEGVSDFELDSQNTALPHTSSTLSKAIHEVNDEATVCYLDGINDSRWSRVYGGMKHPKLDSYILPANGIRRGADGNIDTVMTMTSYVGAAPDDDDLHVSKVKALYSAYALGAKQAVVGTNINGDISTETIPVDTVLGQDKNGNDLTIKDYADTLEKSYQRKDYLKKNGYKREYPQMRITKQQTTHVPSISAWCNVPQERAQKAMYMIVNDDELSNKDRSVILQEIFSQKDPIKEGRVMFFDTETNGLNPTVGAQVIECALSKPNADGTVTDMHDKCGIDHRDLELNGTGAQEVHHIKPDDIRDKPRFADSPTKKAIEQHLANGGILCAHNARFDVAYLKAVGIKVDKNQVIDSKYISEYVEAKGKKDVNNNNLGAFVDRNGGKYFNAHRADADTTMLRNAVTERIRRQWSRHSMRREQLSPHGREVLDSCLDVLNVEKTDRRRRR